jgi:hypothetical protein
LPSSRAGMRSPAWLADILGTEFSGIATAGHLRVALYCAEASVPAGSKKDECEEGGRAGADFWNNVFMEHLI